MDIKRITLGITNTYLIKGKQGYLMIDAGPLRKEAGFRRAISRLGIQPNDIKIIMITHAHYDHVGSLAGIKNMCGGCQVIIHPHEEAILAKAKVVIPPGTNPYGKLVSRIGQNSRKILAFKAVKAELLVDTEFDLEPLGIAGKIVPTPGHTPGSLSLVLNDGRAMVGDLAMNFLGARIYPMFAELPDVVYSSWQQLIDRGVETFYPSHGPHIPAKKIKNQLAGRV